MTRRPGYVPGAAHRRIRNPDPDWQRHIAQRRAERARRAQRRATIAAALLVLFAILAYLA